MFKSNLLPKLITLSVIITLIIWLLSKWYYGDSFSFFGKYIAKTASLSATILFAWSLILSTRIKVIENLAGGLDKLYQVHKNVGMYSFILIFFHPIFLSIEQIPRINAVMSFYFFNLSESNYEIGKNLGIISLLLLIVLIGLTISKKIPYHIWKSTHEYFGVFWIFVIAHIYYVDADIASYPVLKIWMWSIMTFALAAFIYIRFLYHYFGPKYKYKITYLEFIEDIIEITIQSTDKSMLFKPGQFIYIEFQNQFISNEKHPFSLATAYNSEGRIKIGIKISGDYTKTLNNLEIGDSLVIWGPYGTFGDKIFNATNECVLIGGGIGVTPIMSIWDFAINFKKSEFEKLNQRLNLLSKKVVKNWTPPKINFFYLNKTRSGASFHNDTYTSIIKRKFTDTNSKLNEKFYYELYTNEDHDFFNVSYLKTKVTNWKNCNYFICGPKVMTDNIIRSLQKEGIKSSQISYEDFNLLSLPMPLNIIIKFFNQQVLNRYNSKNNFAKIS
jgi:predicted ferric reductase